MPAELPERALVPATVPPEYRGLARDAVRLLVTDRRARTHEHRPFTDLPSVLRPGDLLVVNDSATVPAALCARRADGSSVHLHVATKIDERLFLTEPRGMATRGEVFGLPDDASAVMLAPVDPTRPRLWYATFELPLPMLAYLMKFGEPIRYGYVREPIPLDYYQTIFAREPGSSEMPSAARPFSARVVAGLRERDIEFHTITLHCGVSSFEIPERPSLERFSVSRAAAQGINVARRHERRIIAVGTTVLRALESASVGGEVAATSGWTDLVLDEHHHMQSVDALLTGFHEPAATHTSVLRAFLDKDVLAEGYAEAARAGYRHHEFGDLHLID